MESTAVYIIFQLGCTYGRKMLKGYLDSTGIVCSVSRVGQSLARVNPDNHARRLRGIQGQVNAQKYHAPYFGYNLHVDQNEKVLINFY